MGSWVFKVFGGADVTVTRGATEYSVQVSGDLDSRSEMHFASLNRAQLCATYNLRHAGSRLNVHYVGEAAFRCRFTAPSLIDCQQPALHRQGKARCPSGVCRHLQNQLQLTSFLPFFSIHFHPLPIFQTTHTDQLPSKQLRSKHSSILQLNFHHHD